MAVVYFFLFAAMGALNPYLVLYYRQLGLSATEISMLMSLTPVLLFISQPVFGPLTDRSGHRGRMLSYLLLVVGATGLLVGAGRSFWSLMPLLMIWSFFNGPLTPIADSVALGEVITKGVSYPRLRLWGSVGFLIATTVLGRLYNFLDLRLAFIAYALLNVFAWFFARRLPAEGVSNRRPILPALRRLVANPFLAIFLLLSSIMQITQAAHAAFFSMHMEAVGGSNGMVGIAWGLAALTEVPVFLLLGRVTRRTGPLPLLAVAGLVYGLRWWLYSLVSSAWVLVGLQLLQSLSFAIFMPTAVVLVGELTPPELRTSGQALLVLMNSGLATVLGTLAAGRIVDLQGTAGMYRWSSYVAAVAGLGFLLMLVIRRIRSGGAAGSAARGGA